MNLCGALTTCGYMLQKLTDTREIQYFYFSACLLSAILALLCDIMIQVYVLSLPADP